MVPDSGDAGGHARTNPGTGGSPAVTRLPALPAILRHRGPGAVLRVVDIEPELVLLGGLPGESGRADPLRRRVADLQALVPRIGPDTRIRGVLVAVQVRHVLVGADRPHVAVEPDAVAEERAAEREVGVPVLDQHVLIDEPEAAQLVVEIAALRPLARDAAEVGAAERVAARLRHHVECRPAAIHFREPSGDRDLHFRGIRHVVLISRHPAAPDRRAHVHAVDLNVAFAAAAAARGEEVVGGRGARAETGSLDARHAGQVVAVAAGGGQRSHELVAQHLLPAGAGLHVHHRRRAGHGDGFLDAAHAHITVDGGDTAAAQLDTRSRNRRESLQRKRHGIGARAQIDDLILTTVIGHRRARFFDQRRTRRLNRDPRQHRARRVADDAGERLRAGRGRNEKHAERREE